VIVYQTVSVFITFYHRYALLPPKTHSLCPSVFSVVYAIKVPNYIYVVSRQFNFQT
jgi:hypothetical protein